MLNLINAWIYLSLMVLGAGYKKFNEDVFIEFKNIYRIILYEMWYFKYKKSL